jgi:arsenate reductase
MAEGFFRKHGDDIMEVYSAGFEPADIYPYAVRVMDEIGVDISGQRSKSVKEFLGRVQFGYVIAVCKKAEGRWPVIFPGRLMIRRVRDEIEEKVKAWIAGYRAEHCNHTC